MIRFNIHSKNFSFPEYLKYLTQLPLFSNAGYLLGVNLLPAIIGFFYWTIASRFYSAFTVGVASAFFSTTFLLSGIAGLGMNIGLIRFLPKASNQNRMINSVLSLNILGSIILSVAFLLGIGFWSVQLQPLFNDISFRLILTVFVISATAGASIRESFVAFRKSNYAFIYTLISNILRLILVVIGISLGTIGLVSASMIAFLIAFLSSILFLMPIVSRGFRWSFELYLPDIRSILPFSFSNYIALLVGQMAPIIMPLMTIEILGVKAGAYAYIALMVGALIASPGAALATSALAEGSNDIMQMKNTLKTALIVSEIITIIISLGVAISSYILLTWFGIDYAMEGSGLLRWMAFAGPFVVFNQIYFTYLRLRRKNISLVIFSFSLLFISLFTAFSLLPYIGIKANGIGIFAANITVSIFAFLLIIKREIPLSALKKQL